jgi:hypothetical protein
MKKLIILFSAIIFTQYSYSQSIGIGANTTPDASAVLDVNGTTKGFLVPRMLNTQRGAIPTPALGLMVFQTNTSLSAPIGSAGLYVNLANGWKRIATSEEVSNAATSWTVAGVDQYSGVTGNVGIGTSTPDAKLHIYGNTFKFSGLSGHMLFTSDIFGKKIEFFDASGVETSSITPSTDLTFSTQGHSSHLRLFGSTGNISTSSGVAFDIDGHGNTKETLTLDDDTPGIIFKDGATDEASIRRIGASLHIGNIGVTGGISFRTQDVVKAVLDADGDFGINTPVPAEKLHVVGNAILEGTSATLSLNAGPTEKGFVQLSGDNLRMGTYSTNTLGKIVLRNAGADRMIIDELGNTAFGIDPAGLAAKFAVYGKSRFIGNGAGDALQSTGPAIIDGKLTVNKALEAVHIEGNDPAINFFEAGTQRGYMWMVDNNMNIGTSQASSRINMITDQVTIGTSIATPSTYKLGVGGRIICEELKVKLQSSGWPDYVFAKNYKLKPLDELENYINKNKHLPNIPVAAEIQKEGLEVGEMQRRMMEKIEELTLYVIDLKKEIEKLKKP